MHSIGQLYDCAFYIIQPWQKKLLQTYMDQHHTQILEVLHFWRRMTLEAYKFSLPARNGLMLLRLKIVFCECRRYATLRDKRKAKIYPTQGDQSIRQRKVFLSIFFDPYVNYDFAPLKGTGAPRFKPVNFGDFLRKELEAAYIQHQNSDI